MGETTQEFMQNVSQLCKLAVTVIYTIITSGMLNSYLSRAVDPRLSSAYGFLPFNSDMAITSLTS